LLQNMADGFHAGDAGWMQWALGGLALAVTTVAGWLFAAIAGVRREDAEGRKAIWERLNQRMDAAADDRLEDARLYRADLERLAERLDERLQQSEDRIMQAIRDRGPVKPR
jgi:hypothetical protein